MVVLCMCAGTVMLNSELNYANSSNTMFVVVATDNGQPPLSSTATVYVNLLNTNQYAPVFGQVRSLQVKRIFICLFHLYNMASLQFCAPPPNKI